MRSFSCVLLSMRDPCLDWLFAILILISNGWDNAILLCVIIYSTTTACNNAGQSWGNLCKHLPNSLWKRQRFYYETYDTRINVWKGTLCFKRFRLDLAIENNSQCFLLCLLLALISKQLVSIVSSLLLLSRRQLLNSRWARLRSWLLGSFFWFSLLIKESW